MFLYPPGEEPLFSSHPGQSALSALRLLKPAAGQAAFPPDVSTDKAVAEQLARRCALAQPALLPLRDAALEAAGR